MYENIQIISYTDLTEMEINASVRLGMIFTRGVSEITQMSSFSTKFSVNDIQTSVHSSPSYRSVSMLHDKKILKNKQLRLVKRFNLQDGQEIYFERLHTVTVILKTLSILWSKSNI